MEPARLPGHDFRKKSSQLGWPAAEAAAWRWHASPAKLEGPNALKVLALQEHGGAGSLAQCARCENRRHVSDAMKDPSSLLNVGERGHGDWAMNLSVRWSTIIQPRCTT